MQNNEARLRCKDGSIKHVIIDSNVLWKDGQFVHARCFTCDISERKRLKQSLTFLAEASKSLATLVDLKSTLQMVANLAVPDFADWCAVDMLDSDNSLQRLAVAHADPAKIELAEELHRRYALAFGGCGAALSREARFYADRGGGDVVHGFRDQCHALRRGAVQLLRARDGTLPAMLERKVWGEPLEGLLITAVLTLLIANAFDLTSIATLGSAGFLLIFAAVNTANARDAQHTNSLAWISVVGAVACLAALGALVWHTTLTAPAKLWVLQPRWSRWR